ncbi:MAG: PASTA domain-containing protein, partial [Clostridia bacterium]|nr:PASTA domain-containing protein [Clostridia bacterium]
QHRGSEEKPRPVVSELRRRRTRRTMAGRMLTLFVALVFVGLIAVAGVRLYRSMFIVSRMPDLAGVDAATAERLLASADLTAQLSYAYSDTPEGYVSSQEPAPGEEVRRGAQVTVIISRGSGLATVQRLVGMTQEEALTSIAAQGFVAGETTVAPSEKLRGTVIAQSPEAGASAQIGSEIELTVSGGRVIVPELSGQREEEALARIESVGLEAGSIVYETVDSARQDGVVLSQTPEKFTEVLPGSVVEMTVGLYDRRKYSAPVTLTVDVPEEGVTVRVTLVGEDGKESDMYAATLTEAGKTEISVKLRSEQGGVMTWRLYLDGSFKSEATAVLQ